MDENTAKAEAEKREKHKSKQLAHKRWAAVQKDDGTWGVALQDNHREIARVARNEAKDAFGRLLFAGATVGDLHAASEKMLRAMNAQVISEFEEANPDHPLVKK